MPYEGIDLVSSAGCTYESYNNSHRGFRMIVLDKSDLSTYTSAYYSAKKLLADSWFKLTVKALWERIRTWVQNKIFHVFA